MMMTLNNVLVATDFSECSEKALWQARVMAGASPNATLHLFHVVTDPLHEAWASYARGTDFLELVRGMEATATKRLEALRTPMECSKERVVVATAWGEPVEEILKYARTHHIDLIVCGTHQREGIAHFVMGSTAERLVQLAPCPVFTVPARAEKRVPEREVADAAESARDVPLEAAALRI